MSGKEVTPGRELQVSPGKVRDFEKYLKQRGFQRIEWEYVEFFSMEYIKCVWNDCINCRVETFVSVDEGCLWFGNGAEPLIEDVR